MVYERKVIMFKFLRQIFCDCRFKVITIPIVWEQKTTDKVQQVVKPNMMKQCIKCGKIKPI